MRFSLKWILAGMVYVAIAAASFSRQSLYYADALWLISAVVIITAVMRAVYFQGRQRASAIGFLVGVACLISCLLFSPNAVPTRRLLTTFGIIRDQVSMFYSPGSPLPPPENVYSGIDLSRLRAANAVATLAFGLMGSLVGLMAFRASGEAKGRDSTG